MDQLSTEILTLIFVFCDCPHEFSLLNQRCRAISLAPLSNARRLFRLVGSQFAIHRAFSYPRLLSPTLIEVLISSGAHISIALANSLQHAAGRDLPIWANEPLEEAVVHPQLAAIQDVVSRAAERRFPDQAWVQGVTWHFIDALLVKFDLVVNRPFQDAELGYEESFVELSNGIQHRGLLPFSTQDRTNLEFARGVCLEPRLLPLLQRCGWRWDTEIQDEFVRWSLLPSELLTTRRRRLDLSYPNHIYRILNNQQVYTSVEKVIIEDLSKHLRVSEGLLTVSATVAGEVLAFHGEERTGQDQVRNIVSVGTRTRRSRLVHDFGFERDVTRRAQAALVALDKANLLHFSLRDIAIDILRLAHHTLAPRESPQWIVNLFHTLNEGADGKCQEVELLSTYSTACFFLKVHSPFWYYWEMSSEMITIIWADVLCGPLFTHLGLIKEDERFLGVANFDLSAICLEAAKRLLRLPHKGSLLLEIVALFPAIKEVLRPEILRHRVLIARLPSIPRDPHRSLYSYSLSFLSPLAFDYADARIRYPLGLGPHPWVEGFYAVPPPPSPTPQVSSSVWPIKTRAYEVTKEDGTVLHLGRVTGKMLQVDEKSLIDWPWRRHTKEGDSWIYDRVSEPNLPVAIALLDIFEPKDPALDVFLMHSILNLNPSVTSFYLQEGVPLRPHHLQALDKLGLPRMDCIKLHLAAREQGMTSLPSRATQLQEKSKRKKGRGGGGLRRNG